MNNVTDISKNNVHGKGDNFYYLKDLDGVITGITTSNGGLNVLLSNVGKDSIAVETYPVLGYSRQQVAEFLWAAATFLDSEERYRPTGEMVGINYEV